MSQRIILCISNCYGLCPKNVKILQLQLFTQWSAFVLKDGCYLWELCSHTISRIVSSKNISIGAVI